MDNRFKIALYCSICLFLPMFWLGSAFGLNFSGDSEISQRAIKVAKDELAKISSNISLSKEQIAQLQQETEKLQSDKVAVEKNINQLSQQSKEIAKQLKIEEQNYQKYRAEQEIDMQHFAKARAAISRISGLLERIQMNPPPALAVDPSDIEKMVLSFEVLHLATPKLHEKLNIYHKAEQKLRKAIMLCEQKKIELTNSLTNKLLVNKKLELLLKAKLNKASEVKGQISRKQENIEQLTSRMSEMKEFIAELDAKNQQKNLLKKIGELQQQLASYPHFSKIKGRMLPPVIPLEAIAQIKASKELRNAVEIQLKDKDAAIVAPCAGIVYFAQNFRSYGNMIILDVGEGYFLLLSHLGDLNVVAPSFVGQGQKIAGIDADKKLDIELLHGNDVVNMLPWFKNKERIR